MSCPAGNVADQQDPIVLADALIYAADHATTKQEAINLAQQALKLVPEDFDAQHILAMNTASDVLDMVQMYREIYRNAEVVLQSRGLLDSVEAIGHYWKNMETRPYMRLCHHFIIALVKCGMLKEAQSVCERCLVLCPSDNLGLRYFLMGIYVHYDDTEGAQRLMQGYHGKEDEELSLLHALLLFKANTLNESGKTLRRCKRLNGSLPKFLTLVLQGRMEEEYQEIQRKGSVRYRSIEMYLDIYGICPFLFPLNQVFFTWASGLLSA